MSQVRRNIFWMVFLQAGAYLVPLITFPYLARVLGVHTYGIFGICSAISNYVIIIGEWSFGLSASAEIARANNRSQASQIFWTVSIAKTILISGISLITAALSLIFANPSLVMPILVSCFVTGLGSLLNFNWFLQGLQRMSFLAIASTMGRLAIVPCYFFFVKGPADIVVAVGIQAGSLILIGAISLALIVKYDVVDYTRPSIKLCSQYIRDGWLLFIASAAPNIYTTFNSLVLGFVGGPNFVGIYTPADRIKAASQGVLQPVSKAAYPKSCRLMAENEEKGFQFARKILLLEGILGVCTAVLLLIFAEQIIRILAGAGYEDSVNVLRIFALAPLLVGISDVLGVQVLLPARQEKTFGRIRIGAAITNILALVPLVLLWGPAGAAVGTVLAETYILLTMGFACRKIGFFNRRMLW